MAAATGLAGTRVAALLAAVLSVTVHAAALRLLSGGAAAPRPARIGETTLQLVTPAAAPSSAARGPPPRPAPPPAARRTAPTAPLGPVARASPASAPEAADAPLPAKAAGLEPAARASATPTAEPAVAPGPEPAPAVEGAVAPAWVAARALEGGANRPPAYPPRAIARGWEGEVLVAVEVLASGEAGAVVTRRSSGHALLDRAACEALAAWRYAPALRDGRPARSVLLQPVRFQLER